jgi:hypothetical protein
MVLIIVKVRWTEQRYGSGTIAPQAALLQMYPAGQAWSLLPFAALLQMLPVSAAARPQPTGIM